MTTVTADRGGYNFLERAQQRNPGSVLGQMMTVKQAARDLGITTEALRRLVKAGAGPAHHRCGNRMLFRKADVLAHKSAAAQNTV